MGRFGVLILLLVFVAIAVALFVIVENLPEVESGRVERQEAGNEKEDLGVEAPAAPTLVGSGEATPSETPAPADTEAPFRGRVVDEEGKGVAGARVTGRIFYRKMTPDSDREYVYYNEPPDSEPRLWTSTDARGRFGLDRASVEGLVHPSMFESISALIVHVEADGYPRHLARVPRDTHTEIRILPGGVLEFSVRRDDGTPVEGAKLRLFNTERELDPRSRSLPPLFASLTTDGEGRAKVSAPPGPYRMRVRAMDLVPKDMDPVEVVAGETLAVEVTLDEGVVAKVRVAGPEGEPVAGAKVDVYARQRSGGTQETDGDGRCRIPGLVVPTLEDGNSPLAYWDRAVFYRVMAEGYAFAEGSRQLPPEACEMPLEIELKRGVEVRLRVVDETGAPVPDAWARIEGDRHAANSIRRDLQYAADARGWLRLPRFPPGERAVQVASSRPGYQWVRLDLDVKEEDITRDVVLPSTGASVSGRVVLPDGKPAKDAQVGIAPADASPVTQAQQAQGDTDEQGAFRMDRVAGGEHLVVCRAPGFGVYAERITVRPNEPLDGLVLKLRTGGRIAGVLRAREGEPVPGVTVALYIQGYDGRATRVAEVTATTSDADGRFLFRGVSDGDLDITLRSDDWKLSWPRPDEVHPGDEDLVVTLKPASEGEGILIVAKVTANGAPYEGPLSVQAQSAGSGGAVNGLDVELKGGGVYGLNVTHKGGGVYEMRAWFEPGTYDLLFHAQAWRTQEQEAVTLEDTGVPVEIGVALDRGATLTLRLLDAEGKPRRDTFIRVHNQQIKTDDSGELELTGFEPGVVDRLYISLAADSKWLTTILEDVPVPGRRDVVLRPCGTISVQTETPYAEVPGDALFRLYASDGKLLEERRKAAEKIRKYGGNLGAFFQVFEEGTYRVTLDLGDRHAEATTDAGPRRRVTAQLDPR